MDPKDLILMDNNVVASPRLSEIIDEIVDLGFGPGATMTNPKQVSKLDDELISIRRCRCKNFS